MPDTADKDSAAETQKSRDQQFEEYWASMHKGQQSAELDSNYGKISLMNFIVLSILGLLLPLFLAILLKVPEGFLTILFILFIVLFIVSAIKIRTAHRATAFAYVFIFTAPLSLNLLIGILLAFLLIPSYLSILAGFFGIFVSYWVMSSKNFLG